MGRITKGILGGFSGTVGTVIGGSWKGIDYMRSQPSRRSASSTQRQLEQRMKFSLITKFQATMNGLLNESFRSYAVRMTGANSALSYNIRNAITGTYPDFEIDYSLALVSRGDLPNAQNPAAGVGAGAVVAFEWTNNAGTGKAANNDLAVLVVYCPAKQACAWLEGGERQDEEASITVSNFAGEVVQTWIAFFSADGRETSTSIFTGQLSLVP
jgi:hypothetical protein